MEPVGLSLTLVPKFKNGFRTPIFDGNIGNSVKILGNNGSLGKSKDRVGSRGIPTGKDVVNGPADNGASDGMEKDETVSNVPPKSAISGYITGSSWAAVNVTWKSGISSVTTFCIPSNPFTVPGKAVPSGNCS